MPITLNIQSFLSFAFVALIFLPLPILIVTNLLGYLSDWFMFNSYHKIIEKKYAHLQSIEVEHLKEIFPHKNEKHLESMADYINGKRNSNGN